MNGRPPRPVGKALMRSLRTRWRGIFSREAPPLTSRPPGRPPGSRWSSAEDFKQALRIAIEALEAKGVRATQEKVSGVLFCNPRTLRRWLAEFGVSWTEVARRSPSTKP